MFHPLASDRSSRSPSAGRKSHEGTPQPILEEPEIPVQWGILEDKDTEEHQGQTDEISKPDTVSVQNPGETETLQAKDNPTANTNGLAENSVNPQQQQEAPLQEMEPLHSDEQPPSVETIPPGKQEATPPGKEEQQEAPPPGKEEQQEAPPPEKEEQQEAPPPGKEQLPHEQPTPEATPVTQSPLTSERQEDQLPTTASSSSEEAKLEELPPTNGGPVRNELQPTDGQEGTLNDGHLNGTQDKHFDDQAQISIQDKDELMTHRLGQTVENSSAPNVNGSED